MTAALTPTEFQRAVERLAKSDATLARVVDQYGIPDFWHRPPGFATLSLFIVEQQVSLASAKAVFERLLGLVGEVTADNLVAAPIEGLRKCGLTRQKLRYLRLLSQQVVDAALDLEGLASLSDHEARRTLLSVTGIGPWTADVYLLSALRRPDIWPVGDRALQVGTGELIGHPTVPTPQELEDIGYQWQPWRSVAARLIWHDYLAKRGRAETVVAGLG